MNILQQIQQESIKRELTNRLNFEKAEQNSLISQVQDDVLKGMSEEEILEKARSGKYADTPENRKLGRVGQQYGSKKTDITSSDKEKIKEGFKNPHGMNISNDPETRQAVANHAKDYIKKLHEERKAKKESGGSYADSDEHRVKSGEYGAAREKGSSHEEAQKIANNHWEKVKNEYSK